ncbi:MAG: ABC transporter permease [Deltaproteobacteria bacterium]|nr:MAG: ABC transporter permease [Deltaproteobacteria bacterium]
MTVVRPPSKAGASILASVRPFIEGVGQRTIGAIEGVGLWGLVTLRALLMAFKPPFRIRVFFEALEDVGVGSLGIVLLTGVFAGAVFSLQSVAAFRLFDAESLVGTTVALTLSRELGPVLTGLMVAGRSGSSMATTLGTMRVTEQIDAMEVMAVDAVHYLITPRIVASILMLPLLAILFTFVGMVGAYGVAVGMMGVDPGMFVGNIQVMVLPSDITNGAIKAAVFGLAVSAIGCYKGYTASGGAKGVGEATTSAVVLGSVAVLVLNYFLTSIMFM